MKKLAKVSFLGLLVVLITSLTMFAQENKVDDSRVKALNESNFTKNTKKGIVVVDFYADWCKPCLAMAPILEQVAFETEGKIKFAKVNIDNSKELAAKYNVRSIPCMVVFNKGKEVERFVGYQKKENLMENLRKYMK